METENFQPGYLVQYENGELRKKIDEALKRLEECVMCPRRCKVNRLAGETGVCRTGRFSVVSSYDPHFGEEGPLVGNGGSGTIFFTHCNLHCVFCQNYSISHEGAGIEIPDEQLAAMMVSLQKQGCHNINFVTPSHVVAPILAALPIAIEKGLHVPLVYNSSGYDSVDTIKLFDGVIDIYMPDFKFWSRDSARRFAKAPDYPERAWDAIKEMHRKVGDLEIDSRGIAQRGLLVRHLIMPGGLGETKEILQFLAAAISINTYVNIMDQYHPCGKAYEYPEIARPLDHDAYEEAMKIAKEAGLKRLDDRDWLRMFKRLGL
jgi:putative pyruvate formate lyase activating enzyme